MTTEIPVEFDLCYPCATALGASPRTNAPYFLDYCEHCKKLVYTTLINAEELNDANNVGRPTSRNPIPHGVDQEAEE